MFGSLNELLELNSCNFIFECFGFRAKLGGNQVESPIIASLPQGIALEFERSDAARKLRLMLSELLFIMYQVLMNLWHNVQYLCNK